MMLNYCKTNEELGGTKYLVIRLKARNDLCAKDNMYETHDNIEHELTTSIHNCND